MVSTNKDIVWVFIGECVYYWVRWGCFVSKSMSVPASKTNFNSAFWCKHGLYLYVLLFFLFVCVLVCVCVCVAVVCAFEWVYRRKLTFNQVVGKMERNSVHSFENNVGNLSIEIALENKWVRVSGCIYRLWTCIVCMKTGMKKNKYTKCLTCCSSKFHR